MEITHVISLADVAKRFVKAKGMDGKGFKWLRDAPGRGAKKSEQVGNSLAVMKAIRLFNERNSKPIKAFSARGYDGTPKKIIVMDKADVIRLKGFILRSGSKPGKDAKSATPFKIIDEVKL
jgi:hypothetical protein